MTAIIIDGSNKLFPVIFGVAEIEGRESWEWFFFYLRKCIGAHYDSLRIVSDGVTSWLLHDPSFEKLSK